MKRKHSQAEHSQQKSDGEKDRKTNPQVVPSDEAKPWMTILIIFGTIAIAIAAMLGIFTHSRVAAIWFTWIGVVLLFTAATVWFQNVVREHEAAAPQISKGDLAQTVIP